MKLHIPQHSKTLTAFTVAAACIGGFFANTAQASYYPEDEAKLPIFRPYPNDQGRDGNRA